MKVIRDQKIHITMRDGSCEKTSGIEPTNLLCDKSLKIYQNSETQIYLHGLKFTAELT